MTIKYELQIWDHTEIGDMPELIALGIPNRVLEFSNKRTALLKFDEQVSADEEPGVIEHMVLMEYGANEEFPDDGDVIAQW